MKTHQEATAESGPSTTSLETVPRDIDHDMEAPGDDSSTFDNSTDDSTLATNQENGAIFGYLSLPLLFAGFVQYSIHLYVFVQTQMWGLISTVFLVNEEEEDLNPKSDQGFILLTIHAMVAIVVVYVTVAQVCSGLHITLSENKDDSSILRRGHKLLGKPAAALWAASAITGLVYIYGSSDAAGPQKEEGGEQLAFFLIVIQISGIAMFANLYNGIRAVWGPKEKRDYVLHKGSMYFIIYWIGFVWFGQLVLQFLQVFFFHDCTLQRGPQALVTGTVTSTLEFLIYLWAGRKWGGASYRRRFVVYNMGAMGFQILAFWIGSIYSIARAISNGNGNCFTEKLF